MANNVFVKRLREAKGWDMATIYCAFYPPFNVERNCKYIIEDGYMTIPAGNIIPLDNTGKMGEIIEVVINLEDITRVDFLRERPDIKPPQRGPQALQGAMQDVQGIANQKAEGGSLILPQ